MYKIPPIHFIDRVPVFSVTDEYVENYDEISADHIASIDRGKGNPFIAEDLWSDMEKGTIELIRKWVPDDSSILDIGVGTGRLLTRFPNLRRYGIDVSIGYLRRLVDSGIEVCMGNAEELPYNDSEFDAVVCTDVLEHVIDLHAAVSEIRRVLKSGGAAIVRVPYREDLAKYLSPGYPYRIAHVRSFDEWSLEILFCRIMDFSRVDQRFDKCLSAAELRYWLPRGAGTITMLLTWLARQIPGIKSLLFKLYRPVAISMVFRKSA